MADTTSPTKREPRAPPINWVIDTLGTGFSLDSNGLFHVEDLYMVEKLARKKEITARVLIQVKCPLPSLQDLDSTFYPGIAVHLEVTNYKFGVFFDEAIEIIKQFNGKRLGKEIPSQGVLH